MPEHLTVKIIVVAGWIFSLTLHEWSHGYVAYLGGDHTVKERGFLTWNPLRYADPVFSFLLPILFLLLGGIGLPGGRTLIDHRLLRSRAWESAVSLAGPASNFLLLLVLALAFKIGLIPGGLILTNAMAFLAMVQASAVVLNLLPIPPLDGYGILRPYLPYEVQRTADSLRGYGIFLLFLFLWKSPQVNAWFWSVVETMCLVLGIPMGAADQGLQAMIRWD